MDPKFPQTNLLSTMDNLFKKVILKIIQRHIEARNLLNAIQFGFCTNHNTTLQCMKLTDHVIPNFNNKISAAVIFLNIEKAFVTVRHTGLLYKFLN
jgi:hypothetical protein